jgi:hypothetical protein
MGKTNSSREIEEYEMVIEQLCSTLEGMVLMWLQTVREILTTRERFEPGSKPYDSFSEILYVIGICHEGTIRSDSNRPPRWAVMERLERERFPRLRL